MKCFILAFLLISATTSPSHAWTCNRIGNTTVCDNGQQTVTCNRIGNTTICN